MAFAEHTLVNQYLGDNNVCLICVYVMSKVSIIRYE